MCDILFFGVSEMEYKLKRFQNVINVSKIANIHYFEFTNEYHTFKDSHFFRELIYVDNGTVNVEAESYCGVLQKNNIIIHKEGEVHSLTCSDDDAPSVIIIGFECSSPELDVFSSHPTFLSEDMQKLLTEIIKEGRSVFLPPYDVPNLTDMKKRKDYPFGADQMIKLKMETFLIELIRKGIQEEASDSAPSVSGTKINEIHSYITENFKETISLDELCFIFGTNKTTICKSFKKTYGVTVVDYINHLRIKEAKKLLREGKFNQTQISAMVGFSSIHYFSKIFKKNEKIPPTQYIKTIKAKLEM
jgi:AraC-like DNA-binding protein